jgi:hypothetical protein
MIFATRYWKRSMLPGWLLTPERRPPMVPSNPAAAAVAAWRNDLLAALRYSRNWRLKAYHKAKQLIITHGLSHPMGDLWADMADTYEREYQDLDRRIEVVEQASFTELLPCFRRRQRRRAA